MATTQTASQRVVALGVSIIQRLTGHQGEGRDVTNPRELYAILSLADAKREQSSLAAPLSFDASPSPTSDESMNTRFADFSPRRRRRRNLSPIRPDHHGSMEMLESYRRNIPSMTVIKHSSSLNDLTKQYPNRDNNKRDLVSSQGRSLFLPEITDSKNKVTFQVCMSGKPNKQSKKSRTSSRGKREPTVPHSKLHYKELFTETCPGGNGSLLQESILARLRLRDQKIDRSKPPFPKLEPNKVDLRAYDKYPYQYWELRSESVHQPQDLEIDMIDREQYRMKQKSVLKLKVMDHDKYDRRQRDFYAYCQQDEAMVSSPIKRPRQKPRSYSETPSENNDCNSFGNLIIGPVSENNAPMSATVNPAVVPSNNRKVKQGTPYFLTDEKVVKDTPTEIRADVQTPKGEIGTKVVNISIEHDTPKKRNPKHIEKSMMKQQETRQCNSVREADTSCSCAAADENVPQLGASQSSHPCRGKRQNEHKQKALLHGFKKIEVFGEHKQNLQSDSNEPVLKVANELKKYIPRCHPPIYKLDMRNYPPEGNPIAALCNKEDGEAINRCRSTSVKIVDGTIIMKRLADPDSPQNPVETTENDSKGTKEESFT